MGFDFANYGRLSEAFMKICNAKFGIQRNLSSAETIGNRDVQDLVLRCDNGNALIAQPTPDARNVAIGYNGKVLFGWTNVSSDHWRHGRDGRDWTSTQDSWFTFFNDTGESVATIEWHLKQTSTSHPRVSWSVKVRGADVRVGEMDEDCESGLQAIARTLLK